MTGVEAIRAWVRLDDAMSAFNRMLAERHGVTGAQLAMLRIIAEREPVTLAVLRGNLVMHPATLGQLVDRLAAQGYVSRAPSHLDRRRREVRLTGRGRRLLESAPLAGPVRLRTVLPSPTRVKALADALTDAIQLFGLEEWDVEARNSRNRQRPARGR
jgi:DNA-binding MarR family transcriptional regulator